ncbi:unnamed protein product [Adineta steineri]|uniref:Multivesicular body subunit 12A n=1 Tax=Adineta steineri TaxID=433720 RepID=A0A818S8R5_9BILA|nr:unnamed protein product [Adineta steineri]CAF1323140.1 unnamed protein product [Adineta steineri]CAF3667943.1 unnamed protein product [Adineta steineri]CAF3693624.1 unnamed protein product [Adineta steineri]
MDDSNLPITGICLVSKPGNVPTGYDCIRKAYDEKSKDADLMPDGFLERKDRFVCITHRYPLADNRAYVVEDIKLINERDTPPIPYVGLTQTVDTFEKGTAKRIICVKLVERQVGMKCICDIIFLYRSKRPPQSYTIIGEINGLQMCIKEGIVPSVRPPPPQSPHTRSTTSNLYPSTTDNQFYYQPQSQTSNGQMDHSNTHTLGKKSDEKEILDGIPFSINPKYLTTNRKDANDVSGFDSFRVLSPYDIEQNFHYDFHLERSTL